MAALVRRSRSHRRTVEKPQAVAPERFCLRVTAPVLALGGVLLILTLGWAFFTGFLVGRGENPGEKLAILAPFGQEEDVASKAEIEEKPEPQKEVPETPVVEAKPEVEQVQEAKPKVQERAAHPFTRPDARSMAAWGVREQATAAEKKEAAQPAPARYEYQLRLATFNRREEAEALARKISGKSVRCQIVQRGKLFVLGCALRGTSQAYEEFTALLTKLKVKDPVVVVKKELKAR